MPTLEGDDEVVPPKEGAQTSNSNGLSLMVDDCAYKGKHEDSDTLSTLSTPEDMECRQMLAFALEGCSLLKLGDRGMQVIHEFGAEKTRLYAGIISRKEGKTVGLTVKPPKPKDMRTYLRDAHVTTTGIGLQIGNDLSDSVKAALRKKIQDQAACDALMVDLKRDIANFSDGLQAIDAGFKPVV